MDLSHFLGRLLGIYLLIIVALWMFRKKEFEKTMTQLVSTTGSLALLGILDLLFGLAIAIGHPIWSFNWQGLITLLGYVMIVRGIFRITYPEKVQQYAQKLMKNQTSITVILVVCTVIGIFLLYSSL